MEEQENSLELNISTLPEKCISHILSLTSPRDAVSSMFCSAAQSDVVWEKFLPPCWEYIVSRSVSPLEFASKKDLYFQLCYSPILVDGTKNKSYVLDKNSGKICRMLGPGDLSISWDEYSLRVNQDALGLMLTPLPTYKPVTSRFSEMTHINDISQLLIQARVKRRLLSPNTNYVAHIVYAPRFNNIEFPPLQRNEGFHSRDRDDGWTDMEMGEFFTGDDHDDDDVVEISLWEVRGAYIRMLRNGLIVQGVELRPKVVVPQLNAKDQKTCTCAGFKFIKLLHIHGYNVTINTVTFGIMEFSDLQFEQSVVSLRNQVNNL
ncbi:hypothetical protein TIFTF001_031588 [Ficus carica]|uniref:F-box protein n=1 Tax=Ficus carica TaxID=3494 RepID=A0AA88DVN6_FICCA|nr:hypothetical protein TIFTF001_031588 [Ficus carica]